MVDVNASRQVLDLECLPPSSPPSPIVRSLRSPFRTRLRLWRRNKSRLILPNPAFKDTNSSDSRSERSSCSASQEPQKRKVHFSVDPPVVYLVPHIDEYSKEELRDIWWTACDFSGFRASAKCLAYQVQLDGHVILQGIHDGYSMANQLARQQEEVSSCQEIDKNASLLSFAQIARPTDEDMVRGLLPWTTCSDFACRGLEHYSSRQHQNNVNAVTAHSKQTVFVNQGCCPALQLSELYQTCSRPSLVLARFMGECDMIAAKQVYEHKSKSKNHSVTFKLT